MVGVRAKVRAKVSAEAMVVVRAKVMVTDKAGAEAKVKNMSRPGLGPG